MNTVDKLALKIWEEFHRSTMNGLSVDKTESGHDKLSRIANLEADPELWFAYYFEKYATSAPAPFHKKATKRIIKNQRHWEVRAWSRELAKSARTMMESIYLSLVKKEVRNALMISSSEDNAERLLLPYKLCFELNERIINDYGNLITPGSWKSYEFIIKSGTSFRAVGAGQSPRGTRYENYRVDLILIDDIDTDEECRNPDRVKEKFKWIQEAVIPTVSVSGRYRIIMCGNLISINCCVEYARKLASYVDIVNIRDENGLSSWPDKNTEEDIESILRLMSYASAQKEYFNNPITEGSVFKEMAYKSMRPLKEYKFLVCYTDPSFKDSKKNDFKATGLLGKWKNEIHIIKAFVDQTSTANMIDWHYQIDAFVANRVPVYYYMESNFIQDTLLKEFYGQAEERGKIIPIKGDDRQKPDKFTRIESLLEPLNRNGKLFLNEDEKDNKNMQRLEEQFLALAPGSRAHDDAPDMVEGGTFILNSKTMSGDGQVTVLSKNRTNKKRF
jgi:hypothetical protein